MDTVTPPVQDDAKTSAPDQAPRHPLRWLWQIFIAIAGIITIIVGIILLPAPGPGSLVIWAGLGILATEFIWAKQLLAWLKTTVMRFMHKKKQA